jgi:hypothetical protein
MQVTEIVPGEGVCKFIVRFGHRQKLVMASCNLVRIRHRPSNSRPIGEIPLNVVLCIANPDDFEPCLSIRRMLLSINLSHVDRASGPMFQLGLRSRLIFRYVTLRLHIA